MLTTMLNKYRRWKIRRAFAKIYNLSLKTYYKLFFARIKDRPYQDVARESALLDAIEKFRQVIFVED